MKGLPVVTACFFALFFLSAGSICAQGAKPGFMLGANLIYNNPTGSFANNYSRGGGAEITGGIGLGKTFLMASTGYAYYMGKAGRKDLTNKPVKIGLRQYILGKRFFVNADIGRATIKDQSTGKKTMHNLRGFGAGARLLGLEAAVQFEGWDNPGPMGFSNYWQYRLGYNITL